MQRVIVTGATSFIGIALLELLIKQGDEVVAIIRPASSRRNLLKTLFPKLRLLECDLSEIERLDLPHHKYDILFHLGWAGDFENSRYNLDGQLQNVKYCKAAAELAARYGCQSYLGVGSQAECGVIYEPITADTKDNPMTAYAEAKCLAYSHTKNFCDTYGIRHYWPRLLSAYGVYDRDTTMVMSCIRACKEQRELAMTPAEQIWDYVYVSDAARALLAIVQKGNPKKKYPIASGNGRMLKDYIADIADIMGYQEILKGIGKKKYAKDQVMYLVGNIDELRQDTGFYPEYTFQQGLLKIIGH